MILPPGYEDFVFVNCPFDVDYNPLFKATIFAIYRCGFMPKSALSEDNALENRLDKILRIMKNCKYGIHDISRTEMNKNGLPRFNMPFELGIFFAARHFGNRTQKLKNALVFEREKYSYQQYLSDISGTDIKAHRNDPLIIIRDIRNWLAIAVSPKSIPGAELIILEYKEFERRLPVLLEKAGINQDEMSFNDFCIVIEETFSRPVHAVDL